MQGFWQCMLDEYFIKTAGFQCRIYSSSPCMIMWKGISSSFYTVVDIWMYYSNSVSEWMVTLSDVCLRGPASACVRQSVCVGLCMELHGLYYVTCVVGGSGHRPDAERTVSKADMALVTPVVRVAAHQHWFPWGQSQLLSWVDQGVLYIHMVVSCICYGECCNPLLS